MPAHREALLQDEQASAPSSRSGHVPIPSPSVQGRPDPAFPALSMALTGDWRSRQTPRRHPRQRGGRASGDRLPRAWDRGFNYLARSPVAARFGLGVLEELAMRRLLVAQLASRSGDFIVIAALPFAVFSIGGSGTQVGITFGAGL